ncbi:hypothetical protein FQZ97_1082910 [compost metagenome]
MVLLQALHHLAQRRVIAGQQRREHMALLVFVVQRGGQIEIAHHVQRGAGHALVPTAQQHVPLQLGQQAQHALDALVAGAQHVEGRLKTGGGRAVSGQGDGREGDRRGHFNPGPRPALGGRTG